MTCCYSVAAVKPIIDHAYNDKTLAKMWLQSYQLGPIWVGPTIIPGAAANLYLAHLASDDPTRAALYTVSAVLIFSIMPITLGYMEFNINGACKWKVQSLLAGEGYHMPAWNGISSAHRHSASEKSKKWADEWTMKQLVQRWKEWNDFRWALTGFAVLLIGFAEYLS